MPMNNDKMCKYIYYTHISYIKLHSHINSDLFFWGQPLCGKYASFWMTWL